ncbi:hypothetical protein SDC9_172085 [bioreactor metagenome]|uniref:HTH cro/C1-type domain-containing protein n=1 Tax=bioreactor metagenome TaxID=1076179 RepID=A0A645GLU9_9ZZZZ
MEICINKTQSNKLKHIRRVSKKRILLAAKKSYCILESLLDIFVQWPYTENGKLTFHYRGMLMKNRLEEIRKQRGIKQEDLAYALEVSRQTIGSLENGRYNPSILLAFKIARYFDMSIEEIFIYEEKES